MTPMAPTRETGGGRGESSRGAGLRARLQNTRSPHKTGAEAAEFHRRTLLIAHALRRHAKALLIEGQRAAKDATAQK